MKDYLTFARQNKIPVWGKDESIRRVREVGMVWDVIRATPTLPDVPDFPDLPENLEEAVNLLITLINQAIYLQKKLRFSLEQKFIKEGGFRENLFKKRMEYRKGR